MLLILEAEPRDHQARQQARRGAQPSGERETLAPEEIEHGYED